MKKTILFLISTTIIACSKSPEQVAQKNISEFIKTKSDDPKSYESVKFGKLDTIYSPFSESLEGKKLQKKIEEYDSVQNNYYFKMDEAKTVAEINEYSSLGQKALKQKDSVISDLDLKSSTYKGNIIGFSMKHTFRAKNKMGALVLNDCTAILDLEKNVKSVK